MGEMGGKIPRQIKEKVIRQWLQGTRRSTVVKDNGIGEGTITRVHRKSIMTWNSSGN